MYSDSIGAWVVGAALCGAALTGCSASDEVVSTAPSSARTAATPQLFVVDSQRDSIDAGNVVLVALDFAQPRRATVAGDHQLDSVHPLPGAMTGCDPENERAYVAAMGTLHPRDSGYVGTMQVELSNATRAPDSAASLCFGVRTRAGAWAWHWSPIPITIDYGSRTFNGQPGAGHFDLDVNTADVDMIALMMAYGHGVLSQVKLSAIPSPR